MVAVFAGTSVYMVKVTKQHGVVTGILYIPEDSSAVIDSQIVHEGDTIYGATIVKIEKLQVEFERDGISWKMCFQTK